MSKVPSVNYEQVIRALRRDGWIVVRQHGSHSRLQKQLTEETRFPLIARLNEQH